MTVKLYVNNIQVPLSEALSIKYFNPILNDMGGYSFPITFNGNNLAVQKAFNWPSGKGINNSTLVAGKIKIGHHEYLGTWKVSEASEATIEASFIPERGAFYLAVGDKTLRDLSYGGDRYPLGGLADEEDMVEYFNDFLDASFPENDFAVFMAYMPNASGVEESENCKVVNPVDHDEETGEPFLSYPPSGIGYNNTIYLFAGLIVESIFNEYGYRINSNIFREDPDLRRLTVFNTYRRRYNEPALIRYSDHVPGIRIVDFLKTLRDRFGIVALIEENSRSVSIVSIQNILKKQPRSIISNTALKSFDKNRISGVRLPFVSGDPWMVNGYDSISDMYKYTPQEVAKLRDIPAGPLRTFYLVRSESCYYEVINSDGSYVIERRCVNSFPHLAGSEVSETEINSSHVGQYTYVRQISFEYNEQTRYTDIDYVVPRCDLQGWAASFIDYPLMFCFARGVQPCYIVPASGAPSSLSYPMGSFDVYNALGAKIDDANMALRWGGTYGLVDRLLGEIIEWKLNRQQLCTINSETLVPLEDLIDFSRPVFYGNDKFIVDTFTAELFKNRLVISDLKLLRL
jgi:hypothetical protein